uniref:Protein SDA1 n=1 Tax=Phlebotomus papatasi TaxID=29031 RepID=A0A1B0GP95_PHLPP
MSCLGSKLQNPRHLPLMGIEKSRNVRIETEEEELMNSNQSRNYIQMQKFQLKSLIKMSADIMIELYRKNIWNDAKTVNVIGSVGCFSKVTKVLVVSLRFFLGTDEKEAESGEESEPEPDLRNALMVNRVNKKTKKRKKQLEAAKKQYAKAKRKKTAAPTFNFSALHLIHNPQGMAENLFKQLQASGGLSLEAKSVNLQVAQLYPDVCKNFPQQLIDVLQTFSINLDPTVRNALCKALILLRNKNLIPALQLLELFFQLLRCPDKNFREFVRNHIVTDIKNINAKGKDMKVNSTLQNFMYTMLNDTNPKCAFSYSSHLCHKHHRILQILAPLIRRELENIQGTFKVRILLNKVISV